MKSQTAPTFSLKKPLLFSCLWVFLALLFNAGLWYSLRDTPAVANQAALEFLTGYLIEKSLSLDNIFVFALIFKALNIPVSLQNRVLSYGVFSAMILRLLMIGLGVLCIEKFAFTLPLFGLFLILIGLKMFQKQKERPIPFFSQIKSYLPITGFHKEKFVVRLHKKLYVTPLFVALVLIEAADIVFAVDSIPAIFAVTQDPLIVYTSNMFAILGMRSLYLVLAHMIEKFHFLHYGLSFILLFVGFKLLLASWMSIPTLITLAVILFTLGACIALSVYHAKRV